MSILWLLRSRARQFRAQGECALVEVKPGVVVRVHMLGVAWGRAQQDVGTRRAFEEVRHVVRARRSSRSDVFRANKGGATR